LNCETIECRVSLLVLSVDGWTARRQDAAAAKVGLSIAWQVPISD
jgi:hypothetical protein